jgi:TIR domain
MRLLHIWWESLEQSKLNYIINEQRPEWTINDSNEREVSSLTDVLTLLNSGYDAILLHLSLPFALAVKMAELAHRARQKTKIILYSRTRVDIKTLQKLFDGVIHIDRDIANVAGLIESIVSSERNVITSEDQLQEVIVSIINSSESIRLSFMNVFNVRHRDNWSIDDYYRLVDASITIGSPLRHDVFLSYSEKDSSLANEFALELEQRGLSCFFAKRNIDAGANWVDNIREALRSSREIVIVITPESRKSSWVMIEAGAAWVLGKRLTPCLAYVDHSELPSPILMHQTRVMKTHADMIAIADELASRIRASS